MFNTHFNIVTSNTFKLSTTALIGLLSLTFNATAHSQDIPHGHVIQQEKLVSPTAKGKRQQAQDNTSALKQAMADYRGASAKNKHHYLEQMISLAHGRQALLSELFQSDPSAVAQVTLTAKARKGMPEKVQALLEQEQTLEGELEVFYEDYEDHSKSRLRHVLNTSEGFIEVHGSSQSPINAIQSGVKVRARGWKFKDVADKWDALVVADEADGLSVLAQDSTGTVTASTTTSSAALSDTFGEQRTLVLLVNFQDNPQQPWTIDEVKDMVFGKVNDFYKENSFGQTWLSGDVHGYYTLPINSSCDYKGFESYITAAAEADGIDTSSYSRKVYIYPKVENCGWSGMGTVGGNPSRAWINGAFRLNTIGHELGHNFGLHHAQALECGTNTVGGTCYNYSYGDTLDIMGTSNGHFNAFNKEQLGWIKPSEQEVVTVTNSGTYSLEPYETAPAGAAKGLRIKRGTDAASGQPLWYYIEYRQPIGFDSFLEGQTTITDGVVFHAVTGDDLSSVQLLDMTPNSVNSDLIDAALIAGNTYEDTEAGITITTEWADSSGASVHVSFAEPMCVPSMPSVAVVSNQVSGAEPGSTVGYSVTVTNNDGDGCATSNFAIEANAPSGWVTTPSQLNLAPGTSDTVTVDVTSDQAAIDGTYGITFNVTNVTDTDYDVSATANYVVETAVEACQLSTPFLIMSTNQNWDFEPGSTVSYTATVTNQDSAICDATTFTLAANIPNGWSANSGAMTLIPGETQSITMTVTSSTEATDGTYNIVINAKHSADASLNASQVVSVSIVAPVTGNNAPAAQNDSVTLTSKDPVTIDVLKNDSDPEGDTLKVISVTQGAKGTVQITSNGQLLYSPAKSFKGSDSFSYTISDGVNTASASVNIGFGSSDTSTSTGSKGKGRNK
ncbi:cadherin-like domain-containing protein [Vibrio parahaemolyticus]|uniref:Ig-like domain-containing protein n=1 Tax=Vibrio parahaemolyticus TaxID=670 RepID=UPI001299A080|nr:Ig-like domain-containing protein [Vibrio parahaemolyticus]EJB8570512.1 cadherin-like domain-containing protein [Vibrio parahaemolyticus]ELB2948799.1 cadherin-like domain-containing protein [Vibrio parahaemolyticus]MCZ6378242.1 Ig-like domain-containing protein [Vibrio parahaemolyticus]MRD92980.1 peptidase M11 [Vibrio parahaemolyticus]